MDCLCYVGWAFIDSKTATMKSDQEKCELLPCARSPSLSPWNPMPASSPRLRPPESHPLWQGKQEINQPSGARDKIPRQKKRVAFQGLLPPPPSPPWRREAVFKFVFFRGSLETRCSGGSQSKASVRFVPERSQTASTFPPCFSPCLRVG
jgi:hypothetical protein